MNLENQLTKEKKKRYVQHFHHFILFYFILAHTFAQLSGGRNK